MNKKLFAAFLVVALLMSACSASDAASTSLNSTDNTIKQELIVTTAPAETTTVTEATISTTVPETTEPDNSLYIEPGRHQFRYYDDNTQDYLDYHLFVPNNPQKDMPLIIFLHGMGEVDKIDELKDFGIASVIYQLYGEDFPFFLLMPCTHERSWSKDQIPVTLKSLIDKTVDNLAIDTDHIILTGHSLGAIGTWRMISDYGNYFSCAVPVSCGIDEELDYSNFLNIPIWGFVGTEGFYEENYNKAMVKLVATLQSYGANAELTIFDGLSHGDTISHPYTIELFDWMLSQ